MPKAKSAHLKNIWKGENPSRIFVLLCILILVVCAALVIFNWRPNIFPASAYCTTANCGGGGTNNCANTRSGAGWYCGGNMNGNGTPWWSSTNANYKCTAWHTQIGELYCPNGCVYNPSGWDYCRYHYPPDY